MTRQSTIASVEAQTVPDKADDELRQIFNDGDEIISRLRAIRKPRVFIISGPSGVGKDSVIERLRNIYTDATYVVTATTREKRSDEIDGEHYLFYSKDVFLARLEADEFLEHDLVYENHYGVPRFAVVDGLARNRDVIVKVDVKGHGTLRKKISNTTSIFISPESTEALHKRLLARKTETVNDFEQRLRTASEELQRVDEFDYAVYNEAERLEECVRHICEIIDSERRKVHQPDVEVN